MTSRPRVPWGRRAPPVEAVTHEPELSGLLGAWCAAPCRPVSLSGAVPDCARDDPARAVAMLADALDSERPPVVSLGGAVLLLMADDDEPAAYRWPASSDFPRGAVEDATVLAALAVGVALWSRLPTADEVAAWTDDGGPPMTAEGVE